MEARLDKWLWAARLFKTRTIAADACKNGRISIAGVKQKASKMIKEGDVIEVRKPPITYSFKVLKAIQNRVGAKLVPEVLENVTPKEQLELVTKRMAMENKTLDQYINDMASNPMAQQQIAMEQAARKKVSYLIFHFLRHGNIHILNALMNVPGL